MNAITKLPTHADTAATTLRQALAASHAQLRDAVTTYRAAAAASAPDFLETTRTKWIPTLEQVG